MKSLLTLLTVLFVSLALGFLAYGGYQGAGYLWSAYMEIDKSVRVVLLSAMAIVLLASILIASAVKSTAFIAGRRQFGVEKLRLYNSLVEIYRPYLVVLGQSSPASNADAQRKLGEIETEMQILSAIAVLDAHAKLKAALRNREDKASVNVLMQRLIKEIRRDLGHGTDFEESKLKFLIASGRVDEVEASSPGVSVGSNNRAL